MQADLGRCDPALLHLPDRVVAALLATTTGLRAGQIMLVGARCRDILHSALGHAEDLVATKDVDLGLVLADAAGYAEIVGTLTVSGSTGVRYLVDGAPTDLMPFGDVEDPTGEVTPGARDEPLSVWAFREVFAEASTLRLPSGVQIAIPTVAGYAALKLAAWLDRSPQGIYKDAGDLAVSLHWYEESSAVEEQLYATPAGHDLLARYEWSVRQAAAHVLGRDVAQVIGVERLRELVARWPGPSSGELTRHLGLGRAGGAWPRDHAEREAVWQAMASGWRDDRPD